MEISSSRMKKSAEIDFSSLIFFLYFKTELSELEK